MGLSIDAQVPRRVSRPLALSPGTATNLDEALTHGHAAAVALRPLACARLRAPCTAVWWQLRGCTRINASEGRFELRRGEWMVFDAESLQELQVLPGGLTAGLLLSQRIEAGHGSLLPGSGRANATELRIAMRLWRRYASSPQCEMRQAAAIRPLLLHLHYVQRDQQRLVADCPGRTLARKRQVLARMQRVRMLLAGNVHRNVRLAELAELSRFSDWWVSKTFRAVYGETVQQAALAFRMQRAHALLETTALSIAEVGEACGFHDPCSFARQFKRTHGVTASYWRERSRSNRPGMPIRLSSGQMRWRTATHDAARQAT